MNFGSASPSNWWRQPCLGEDTVLPFLQSVGRKFAHRLMEQLVEIQPRAEMQKSAAKPDRSTIHENELARHQNRPPFLQGLMDNKGFLAAIVRRRHAIGDAPHPVVEQSA